MTRRDYLIAALLVGALGCFCSSRRDAAFAGGVGRSAMELELSLVLDRNEIIAGEDTGLAVIYRNAGSATLLLPDPERKNPWSQVLVRDLKRGTEKGFAPGDVVRKGADAFKIQIPVTPNTLSPAQVLRDETSLLKRVELPGAGQYELTALFGYDTERVASKPAGLTVNPLRLRGADFVGAHSGSSPYRYAVWSHAQGGGSVVILTCVSFDESGHVRTTFSNRLAEPGQPVIPSVSVSQNLLPYENHWIVWLAGSQLNGVYVAQGKVKLATHPLNVEIPHPALIGPVLHDLSRSDGSKPGRGEVAFWSPALGRCVLAIRVLEPDGSLKPGPSYDVAPGNLKWGRATMLSDGERRFFLVVERKEETALEMVRWQGEAATKEKIQPLARWNGTSIASGMALDKEDAVFGATLQAIRAKYGNVQSYSLNQWRVGADGKAAAEPPIPVSLAAGSDVDRAVVQPSPAGNLAAFLHIRNGGWLVCNKSGVCGPLPQSLVPFGEPIGAFWFVEAEPLAVMSGPETGITYQKLIMK